MKKIFSLVVCLTFLCAAASFANETKVEQKNSSVPIQSTETTVKRCQCKKIFEQTLGLTPEQIELADKNRAQEQKELKCVNKKIKALKKVKNAEKKAQKRAELVAKKAEIKAKHNEIFESYLTDSQKEKLKQMRIDKKNGKSCCPCSKNIYY